MPRVGLVGIGVVGGLVEIVGLTAADADAKDP